MRKTKIRKDKLGALLAFFVLAPAISIVFGIALVNYVIRPYFDSDGGIEIISERNKGEENAQRDGDNETPVSNEGNSNNIDREIKTTAIQRNLNTLYNIQVGNFTDAENAQALVNELNSKDIIAYVIKQDGYKVMAGTSFFRKDVDEHIPYIREEYLDAFVSTMSIADKKINYGAEDEVYIDSITEIIKSLNKAFEEEVTIWTKTARIKDGELLKEALNNNNNRIDNTIKELKGKTKSQELDGVITDVEGIISKRKDLIALLSKDSSMVKGYEEYMKVFFQYANLFN